MHTNINIKDINNTYNYIVEYKSTSKEVLKEGYSYYPCGMRVANGDIDIYKVSIKYPGLDWYRNKNYWHKLNDSSINDYLPDTIKLSELTLYFPDFSLDTYNPKTKYALSLDTWIQGHRIALGSWILQRMDSLATSKPKTFMNNSYYECITIEFPDPHYIIYSDEWREFRENICGELYIDNTTLNNTGSNLYVSLYAVEEDGNEYNMIDGITGGQNSINISKPHDYLSLDLSVNVTESLSTLEEPAIQCELIFNEEYNSNLKEYLKETYNIDKYNVKYGLAIGNNESLYLAIESDILDSNIIAYKFTKDDILKTGNFTSGDGFIEGLNIVSSIDILGEDGESLLYLLSNKIPFTQDIFRYFVGSKFIVNGYSINNVNLSDVNMNVYNINAVNKIEQKIVQLNHQNDSKANIIQPVFFRSIETRDIILHPAVSETISLNLDVYKSKVATFQIQIEGVCFVEVGRVSNGVLFKIIGNKLPKEISTGLYYILNEDGELITTGKYTYEI